MTVDHRPAPHTGWRATAATVLIMAGAVAAHGWAGGRLPGLPGLLVLTGLVQSAGVLALRGTVGRVVLLPGVALAQAVLHISFAGMSGHHAAHAHAAGPPPGELWTWQMLLAHAAVTVLTAVLWSLCERSAHTVLRLLPALTTYVARPPAPPRHGAWLPEPTVQALLAALPPRGPPPLTAAA